MSITRIKTVAFQGIEVLPIDVQTSITSGLVNFMVVGLPDKAVGESRERVRAALHAMGLALPSKRIVINLAPADVLKEGSHFDLPIALGVLSALHIIGADQLQNFIALGELALDGALTGINGALPAAMHAMERDCGLICPSHNGAEAAWVGGLDIVAADSLLSILNHFKGSQVLSRPEPKIVAASEKKPPDLRDIKGQHTAKRALEIAAAGAHNMLMIGPPGSGKSMLASRLPSILPELSPQEALEVSMIHSISGLLDDGRISRFRPYRDPHHSASLPALVGGGLRAMPGEISLAHQGVLFLDELPEFQRPTLEALRQPIETGRALIARANAHITYPARFQLIAAMNPCRCGYLSDPAQCCSKAPRCGADYQGKISGPIFDRIDLHVDVPAVAAADLNRDSDGEDSATVAARILSARERAWARFQNLESPCRSNAEADGDTLAKIAQMDGGAQKLLADAADKMKLSARGYHRIIRVARSIADLAANDNIQKSHIAEALAYRRLSLGG